MRGARERLTAAPDRARSRQVTQDDRRAEDAGKTRDFLKAFVEKNGGKVLSVKEFKFDIPNMFKFHKKPKVSYNVDLFVIEKGD